MSNRDKEQPSERRTAQQQPTVAEGSRAYTLAQELPVGGDGGGGDGCAVVGCHLEEARRRSDDDIRHFRVRERRRERRGKEV